MAKIRNYREASRAYKDLEEEMAFERGQLKASAPVWPSNLEDEDGDLPLDLSSSSSKEPPSMPNTAQSFPQTPESPELPSPVAGVNRNRDWSNEEADINLVNAFRQNCSQDGNNYQDYDLILGVPAKRASIMDVHAATDARYLRDVIKTEDVTSRPGPLSTGSEVNTFRKNCSQGGNRRWSAVQEEDGRNGSPERDSNSSSCNESTPSDGSVSPQPQEVPSRSDLSSSTQKKRLSEGAKWMMEQGISAYISHDDVVFSELKDLKQRLGGLVQAGNLTEAQVEELLKNVRKKGKNTNTARNSRSRKEAEVDNLKRAVGTAEQRQKQEREEREELLAELRHWEGKLAALSRDLMLSCRKNPEEYQIVVEGDEVRFTLRQDLKVVGLGLRT